jgi:hypothetical protein
MIAILHWAVADTFFCHSGGLGFGELRNADIDLDDRQIGEGAGLSSSCSVPGNGGVRLKRRTKRR